MKYTKISQSYHKRKTRETQRKIKKKTSATQGVSGTQEVLQKPNTIQRTIEKNKQKFGVYPKEKEKKEKRWKGVKIQLVYQGKKKFFQKLIGVVKC